MASTVVQTIEDIISFRPMDIKFIQRCINDFLDEKYHNGIPNHMNYGEHIERYPRCGSVHFVKNGFDYNHKHEYIVNVCLNKPFLHFYSYSFIYSTQIHDNYFLPNIRL